MSLEQPNTLVVPQEGDLRVMYIKNPPADPVYFSVGSVEEAAKLITDLADQDLQDPSVVANVFELEVYQNGEWDIWISDDGYTINELDLNALF